MFKNSRGYEIRDGFRNVSRPVGSPSDSKDEGWWTWFKKNYVYIVAGTVFIGTFTGTFFYFAYTYTQQEYINSIVSENGYLYENLDRDKAFEWLCTYKNTPVMKQIGIGQNVDLMNHGVFKSQRNFVSVTQVLVQLEDLLLLYTTYAGEEMVYLTGDRGFPTIFTPHDAALAKGIYKEIVSGQNLFARAKVLERMLASSEHGPALAKFLQTEEDFILRKFVYSHPNSESYF